MTVLEINTPYREAMINITDKIYDEIKKSGIVDGLCTIFVPHTTAGITINENADPDVKDDIVKGLREMIPNIHFKHMEGNSDAHIKASVIGSSVNLIIDNGRPVLGTWQGIYFCEFDGPRRRKIYINFV
ncbi:secondary thiamine-phosphate synthase enzyme YjbQ [Thermoanaerobacterium sp. RBIITD]|uniref:secondary thiamine-phosphate synthase enzyme YjbQ n=1 Tax=Thermoanaerobacterium sp. RBIITD TaxID=1550240 RepID=UPI000BB78215|nr:secondary thiamine-phosphate synthase enzyme YjbQ [Thermoanaerobacterium sp. RBIITD]SNX54509.1 secondary thiamine-phosphate synthase enzyme [Thermoanaerobacterium sp. RBIITD]